MKTRVVGAVLIVIGIVAFVAPLNTPDSLTNFLAAAASGFLIAIGFFMLIGEV